MDAGLMWRDVVQSKWVPLAALVIAVVALGFAVWPVLRPGPSYTETEVADATTRVCAAYDLALRGVSTQTNQVVPPEDVAGTQAAAANARLALVVASEDLHTAVDASSAAPAGLRDAVRGLADEYRIIAANYLAGLGNDAPVIAEASGRAGTAATTITATCQK
jgi:hypothetical protein